MKKNILNVIAAASAIAVAMVPATVNAAGATQNSSQGVMGANNCEVVISNYGGARANVVIPTKIAMNGVKSCDYELYAYEQIANLNDLDTDLHVVPQDSFTLNREDKSGTATATVTQDKTVFTAEDIKNGEDATVTFTDKDGNNPEERAIKKVTTKGHLKANITEGSWKGTLVFTIS